MSEPATTRVTVNPDVHGWLTENETTSSPCGWCGDLVRWGVPTDHAAHSWGVCVGREPPDDKDSAPYKGRVAVFVVTWNDDVSGDDIRRLSRSWAEKISDRQAVDNVHLNTYGTVERGAGALRYLRPSGASE